MMGKIWLMGTLGCINDMLQRDKENRELRKRNRERLTDTYHRLLDTGKETDLSQMTVEKMEDIRRKTLEKETQQSKITEICIEQLFRSRERSSLSLQDLLFLSCKHRSDSRIVVETITQMFVYRFVHPVFSLPVTVALEITVLSGKFQKIFDAVPDFGQSGVLDRRTGVNPRPPLRIGHRKQVQRIGEMTPGYIGTLLIAAVGLVDRDHIGHLHDAALDPLQFVAGAGALAKKKNKAHRKHRRRGQPPPPPRA